MVSGDGMVSDERMVGGRSYQRPRAFDDAPLMVKVYGGKTLRGASTSQLLFTLETTDSTRLQKTFSEDIIGGSTASQVYTQISTNSIDVHTGDDTVYSLLGLVHTVL
jgi:hypothetical protein